MKRLLGVLLLLALLLTIFEANAGGRKRRCSNLSRSQRHELAARRKLKRETFGTARRNIFGQLPGMACPGVKTCAAK